MGRGRQKAKDAKIARQLKYSAPGSDLRALERELVVGGSPLPAAVVNVADDEDENDPYVDRWASDE